MKRLMNKISLKYPFNSTCTLDCGSLNLVNVEGRKKIITSNFWSIIIFVTVIVVGLATAAYLHHLDSHSLYFYSDAAPHAFLARSYVDSTRPGLFEHLGTVWLPLPQLLLLPFTLIDPLFSSGFAGLLVSLPSHAITSSIIYKLIKRYVENPYIPVIGAFLYAFNPNFLYLSLVSMTEAPFMFFFVASAYYLQGWLHNSAKNFDLKTTGNNFLVYTRSLVSRNLIKCGIFVSLATLCRYEAWILPVPLVIIAILILIKNNKRSDSPLVTKHIIITVFIFSIISFSGIIFWLTWNAYSFGDPLEFSNNKIYSAAAQALQGEGRFLLYQPYNVVSVYGTTLLYTFGPLVLIAALLGFLSSTVFSKDKDKSKRIILYLILVLPAIFTILSMLGGIGEMNLRGWFNSRFLILLGPLLALLDCMFIVYITEKIKNLTVKRETIIIVSIVAALFAFQISSPSFIVVTFANATKDYQGAKLAHKAGQDLGSIYDGNGKILILTDAGDISKISVDSGVPLKHFIRVSDSNLNSTTFDEPWLSAKYVVVSKQPKWDAKNTVKQWNSNEEFLSNFYDKIYDNKKYIIYVTKSQ